MKFINTNILNGRTFLAAMLLSLLTACGGGGGGGGGGTGAAADTVAPTVTATSPADAATGFAPNAAITATFSEAMDAATIDASTFTLSDGTNAVTGTVSYSGAVATFTPSSNLAYSTTYTATLTTGVQDTAGNAMAADFTWSFVTDANIVPDITAPAVIATSPATNASNVAVNSPISFTVNEALNPATVNASTFTLNNGVTGTVSYIHPVVTFTPSANLANSTVYTATVTTGVQDAADNALAADYTWSFTTTSIPDTTPPVVTTTSPANAATSIAVNSVITASFSETLTPATVNTSTFTLDNGVTGTVSYSGGVATFTPSSPLAYSTTYTATLTSGVQDAAGNAMAADYVWSFTTGAPVPSLLNLAGRPDGSGSFDGTITTARFGQLSSVAVDSTGNFYVADTNNHVIRKITAAGVVTILAGTPGILGSANGTGTAASFTSPYGIAVDSTGNVYVSEPLRNTIRKITPAGVVSTFAGASWSGSADGTGTAASFKRPQGIAVDSAGNVYVADSWNDTIRKITPLGVVTTLAGTAGLLGYTDATGAAARFTYPMDIAADGAGNLYVACTYTIRKVTPAGVVTTVAGSPGMIGSANGTGAAASFRFPKGIAVDSAGNVYIADTDNHTFRKMTPARVVTTLAGTAGSYGSADGSGASARFDTPKGLAADSAGNIYMADTVNSTIRKITSAGVVTTLAGMASPKGSANGSGTAARFNAPHGIASDSAGNAYVADTSNHTIRKITPAGVVTTLAGTAGVAGSADATGVAARFNFPQGIATDSAGNVYVADTDNHTIRKITPAGVVSTLAGTAGVAGNVNGSGAAASFYKPQSVAADSTGNIYVADAMNNAIRKITPAGVVSTMATAIYGVERITADSLGNVYVINGSSYISKITPGGGASTLAGATILGNVDGTGGAARFNLPHDLTIDSADNIYVADTGNHTIRKITPAGVVTTVVGVAGEGHFVAGALPAAISFPEAVSISGTSLYIVSNNGVAVVQNVP